MAQQVEIQELLLLADGYLIELGDIIFLEQTSGCLDCSDVDLAYNILELQLALQHKLDTSDYGEQTDVLYACLQKVIQNYSGASLTVDPNAQIPNTTIDVTTLGNNRPYEITFGWSDFIDNGLDGRVRYENPYWVGFNPILSVDNMPYLVLGVDYDLLATGGFVLLSGGNLAALYDGQIMRAVGYEPYVAPPTVVGVALIDNQSSISISYQDDGGSLTALPAGQQFFKDPIIDHQSLYIDYTGTRLEQTEYNADGTIFFHIVLTGSGTTISNMDITKRYEIIITNL